MDWVGGTYTFSPSDLSTLLGCAHASALSRAAARGERPRPPHAGAYGQLIQQKGNEHEAAYKLALEQAGREVVEVGLGSGWPSGAARTAGLMRAGCEVIYQAVFTVDGWRGLADFVERVSDPSPLGDWSYEAVDTKLAREEAKPAHALQLCFYSRGIAEVQGQAPRRAHLVLGSGRRETLRPAEIAAYFRRAQAGMARAAARDLPTEPYPCDACTFCGFRTECETGWRASDHLSLVAGVSHAQFDRLRAAGVGTRTELGMLRPEARVPDLRAATLVGLRDQARLQVAADTAAEIPYEWLPPAAGRGLARLPAPSAGDVMFDIEGDPYFTAAGDLTFLFGLVLAVPGGWEYRAIWAHDADQERAAFEQLVDLLTARLAQFPDMHVYHYSPAETSVVKRLMMRHATREAAVDHLLRNEVFVDLFGIVRQGLRAGVESYGLKQIERLAGFVRSPGVSGGADAVLGYERWRGSQEQAELDAIAAYNAEDCEATRVLRDWLVAHRPSELPEPEPSDVRERSPEAIERERVVEELRASLADGEEPGSWRWLAGELLLYHQREQRPAWWGYFARQGMSSEELAADDSEAMGGLQPAGPPVKVTSNWERTFRFPAQRHKLAAGDRALIDDGRQVVIGALDDDAGAVTLLARLLEHEIPTALRPGPPIDNHPQRAALMRIATSIRDGTAAYPALEAILRRDAPRIVGVATGASIQTTALREQQALARGLDRSCLLVQGPPGTGKTWTGARLIVDLLEAGKRVGVTALSHRAINNLLQAVVEAAAERNRVFHGARKVNENPESRMRDGSWIENVDDGKALLAGGYQLVAGTTWAFAPDVWDGELDYLVIDEAGQLSLADAIAAGTAASNLVLLGDPLQLPQVSQATHPEGTNASVLEHLLGDDATVRPERGLFLETTWRMHPDVCSFVSDEVYEGRLKSLEACASQNTGAGTGLRFLAVEHAGNSDQSRQEADAIGAFLDDLIGRSYTDMSGSTRSLTRADVMVVAPYNAQVRLLLHTLGPGVRVGTVDRFQGQEAPVVVFSMATSSGADIPRNVAFLFSRNRLNVAVSRARCLAVLCCSPALLDTPARTIDDMRLISTLCALVERAGAPVA